MITSQSLSRAWSMRIRAISISFSICKMVRVMVWLLAGVSVDPYYPLLSTLSTTLSTIITRAIFNA